MAVSWLGWDYDGIIAYAKQLFGDGWASDDAVALEVDKAIHNAWCEAQVLMPHDAATEAVADDPESQPTILNVYWFKKSLADAGLLIDRLSPLVQTLRDDANAWFLQVTKDTQVSEAIHTFET
ncbi:MAG TPA: hypothetical protein VMY35_10490 [Phycisphaerae bacterium]|nr:hypothetical protein [Phycisphaerae bacterium]